MVFTHQRWPFEQGMALEVHAARTEAFIFARCRTALLPAMEVGGGTRGPRRWWWMLLEGEAYFDTPSGLRTLAPGQVLYGDESDVRLRRTSPTADFLQAMWRGERDDWGDGTTDLDGARGFADQLANGTLTESPTPLLGAYFDPTEIRFPLAEPDDAATAQVVCHHSQRLAAHPSVEELAADLGLSPRRASERVGTYLRRYHASFSGWRRYLATLRIELAHSLLTARRASASSTASALGYRSASSMYHALQRRGLSLRGDPSPDA